MSERMHALSAESPQTPEHLPSAQEFIQSYMEKRPILLEKLRENAAKMKPVRTLDFLLKDLATKLNVNRSIQEKEMQRTGTTDPALALAGLEKGLNALCRRIPGVVEEDLTTPIEDEFESGSENEIAA